MGTIAGGHQKLVLGDEGVTVVTGKGRRATIRFDRCEAMLQWKNGYRILFGSDGFIIQIRPSLWQRGKRAVATLDQALADRAIAMPTDPPDAGAAAKAPNYLWRAFVAGFFGLGAIANAVDPEENAEGNVVANALIALALLTFAALSLRAHLRRGS